MATPVFVHAPAVIFQCSLVSYCNRLKTRSLHGGIISPMANPSHPSQARVAFGSFEFDPASGDLNKQGTPIRLAKQPSQILAALLRKAGEVVSRDELRQQLWRDETFGDFEHGLNAAINKLRQTLGDSADQPRYIETLPGRGYRFIASVQHVMPATKTPAALQRVEPIATPVRKTGVMWVGGAVLIAASMAGAYWIGTKGKLETARPVVRFTVTPPAGHSIEPAGTRQAFSVSPDGSRLAFTAVDSEGVFRIFMRDLATLESRALPGSEGVHNIFWSPDGASLFAHIRGSLRRTGPADGSYQVICELPPQMATGEWIPPGKILLSNQLRSFVVPAAGGTPQALENQVYPWSQMLPDGEHLLYVRLDRKRERMLASVARFGKPESGRDILETDSKVMYMPSAGRSGRGYLLYVRAGTLLAQHFDPSSFRLSGDPSAVADKIFTFSTTAAADFSVSPNGVLAYAPFRGRSQLAWLDRKGVEVGTVGRSGTAVEYVRISPDQTKAVADFYDVEKGRTETWMLDLSNGASRPVVRGPGQQNHAVWAPDSHRIAYSRAFGGPPGLYLGGVGENDLEEALPPGGYQLANDWSPDGRYIAFGNTSFPMIASDQGGDVSVIDMQRNRKVTAILSTPFRESTARFSPDGKSLAFIADDSGRPEIYVQSFEGGETPRVTGERRLVSRNGALFLRWQRDGRAMVYLGTDNRVYSLPVSHGARLEFGAPVALFTIPAEARAVLPHGFGFDVAADGSRFLVPVLRSREPASLVVVQNWESMLKR